MANKDSSTELALVERVMNTEKLISKLSSVNVQAVPTDELVTAFCLTNGLSKKLEKFVDAAKKELVTNASKDAPVAVGRFFDGSAEEDEKGHLWLTGADGSRVKAEKRVSVKLNTERATELLTERDLYMQATDAMNTLAVPADKAIATFVAVAETLEVLAPALDEAARSELFAIAGTLRCMCETKRVLNEAKIEALAALEVLSMEDVESIMDTTITYAVKG